MVSLPAITLNAAYRANTAPPPGTPLAVLAWRVLLASRACVLFVPTISRRTRLIPQVCWAASWHLSGVQRCLTGTMAAGFEQRRARLRPQWTQIALSAPGACQQIALSLLALALARQFNEQTCATALFSDRQVSRGHRGACKDRRTHHAHCESRQIPASSVDGASRVPTPSRWRIEGAKSPSVKLLHTPHSNRSCRCWAC